MAKKDSKKKKKADADDAPKDLGEAVRSTLERTFQAYTEGAQTTGDRTRAVIDEIAAAAARVRQTMTDTRVLDELQGLRREVEALAQRVAALETAKTTRRSAARKPATTAKAGSTTRRSQAGRRSSSSSSSS